jgi:hypothetical protein
LYLKHSKAFSKHLRLVQIRLDYGGETQANPSQIGRAFGLAGMDNISMQRMQRDVNPYPILINIVSNQL